MCLFFLIPSSNLCFLVGCTWCSLVMTMVTVSVIKALYHWWHFLHSLIIAVLIVQSANWKRPSSPVPLCCHSVVLWVQVPAGAAWEYSSPGSAFCADSYFIVSSTPVLPQWRVKDNCHCAKSAGGRLQLNTHEFMYMALNDTVNWYVIVWWTMNVQKDGSSFMWHQPCNNQTAL